MASRGGGDEAYVIGLCNRVLGEQALTQHRFDWRVLARDSDEDRVTDAFRAWLLTEGWTPIEPTDRWTDLEAVRGEERLICEAKGRTSEKGIDATSPTGVPAHVRALLRIDVTR
ncbi:hypothetical protein ACFV16_20910 [Streptomyces massasporeus]|uniref:hypothetical protein n=1 Tax=Streptomyces massasporeus TaxID=67324 RepID=UPI0036CF8C71